MNQKFTGYLLAKSIIHHGGNEKTGSTPVLRSIYLFQEKLGSYILFPYINGNAIRGKLRRLVFKNFMDMIDLKVDDLKIKVYHALFAGGVLESTLDQYGIIDLQFRRDLRKHLPPLSLFGCAFGNQMVAGKMKIGHAFPICHEYLEYLPDEYKNDVRCSKSIREFISESFITHKDDLRVERTSDDEQAVQMKVDFECFVPGTKFYHWIALESVDEIEYSCFGWMMKLFEGSPYIGAMSAIGYGEVSFSYFPAFPSEEKFLKLIEQKKEEIVGFIRQLEEKI